MAASQRAQREPMGKVDTAWLRMEKPTNLMMICGVLMLRQPLSLARLRRAVTERFLAFPRFRDTPVDAPAGACWQRDPDFDIARHVLPVELPAPGGKAGLQALVSTLASTPLQAGRPLWQFHLVEHCDGGSAVICRIHHCYADGIALVQVMLSMTDLVRRPRRAAINPDWLGDAAEPVARRLGGLPEAFGNAARIGSKIVEKGVELTLNPTLAGVLAKEGGTIAAELAHLLALDDDADTLLKGELSTRKQCAWAEPLDLDAVKAVGRGVCCTVNDVLLAAAAGAIRGHLLARGETLDGVVIRATVPVNLRPLEHARQLGNHFGLVFLDLPVGEANPIRRLELIAASMAGLKESKQALVAYGLLAALGTLPSALQRGALDLLSRKASLVATNVPGPQAPLYLGGSEIEEMMFWVPQTGAIGLGISLLSYNGRVHFGLMADERRVPDPADVAARFRPEFDTLLYATLMADWSEPVRADPCAAMLEHYVRHDS